MGDRSRIEWTGSTWTPIRARNRATGKVGWHCTHASDGCRFCYAEGMNLRLGTGLAYKPGHLADVDIFLDEQMLLQPLRWRRPRAIFVCSMTDLFADFVPDEMIDRIFAVMALCPQHTFQVLTKRPERMREYLTKPHRPGQFITIDDDGRQFDTPGASVRTHGAMCDLFVRAPARALNEASDWQEKHYPGGDGFIRKWPLPNVWLGTSCEDQATADARIPDLLATPAAIRFVSAEPLLGPIDFASSIDLPGGWYEVWPLGQKHLGRDDIDDEGRPFLRLDWIIAGGESGPFARPMHPAWARAIRDQCAATGVAFHFKQRGAWSWTESNDGEWPIDADGFIRLRADGVRAADGWPFQRVGKKLAGRLLDGVEHNGMPVRKLVDAA